MHDNENIITAVFDDQLVNTYRIPIYKKIQENILGLKITVEKDRLVQLVQKNSVLH